MLFVDRANGATVTDVDGTEYIDDHGGASVVVCGTPQLSGSRQQHGELLQHGAKAAMTTSRIHIPISGIFDNNGRGDRVGRVTA